jgi:hypothetical protein
MALQIRRGPTIDRLGDGSPQNPGRYFAEGELVYDTTDKEVYIGDGPPGTVGGGTLGGKPITTFTADQAKDAASATLTDNGLHSNISFTYDNVTKKLSAVVALDGTYNDLIQDTTPELGGNLLLNGNNIVGTGDISIIGDISATAFLGNVTGNLLGNVTGDVTGDVTGNLLGDVTGNLLGDVTGNLLGDVTGNLLGDVTGDVTGNLLGDVTGNLLGNVTGDVTGSVTGTVSSLANHTTSNLAEGTNLYYTDNKVDSRIASSSINALADVNTVSVAPVIGQGLGWNGTAWVPTTLASGTITSVNSNTGPTVVLTTDDIAQGVTNQYYTVAAARNAVSAGTGIIYNASSGVISVSSTVISSSSVFTTDISPIAPGNEIFINSDLTITLDCRVEGTMRSSSVVVTTNNVLHTQLEPTYSQFNTPVQFGQYTTTNRDLIDPLNLRAGTIIWNTTTSTFQGWNGTAWVTFTTT